MWFATKDLLIGSRQPGGVRSESGLIILMPPPCVVDSVTEHREVAWESGVGPMTGASRPAGRPLPQQRCLDPAGDREHGGVGLRETQDLQAQR